MTPHSKHARASSAATISERHKDLSFTTDAERAKLLHTRASLNAYLSTVLEARDRLESLVDTIRMLQEDADLMLKELPVFDNRTERWSVVDGEGVRHVMSMDDAWKRLGIGNRDRGRLGRQLEFVREMVGKVRKYAMVDVEALLRGVGGR
ncbi:hypothetical protein M011DRAFT_474834 [Sporormia fimetaria CBS 119925]|uniref:Uncharacterized protein n=1 Tax=Sporormia fimetaria CBS 119925 TaxID=1340428 RepID=A0A6A6VKY5_9PLEO|nr:hypothetical protein M011DRAFT_474834 [Sporormia fimetaria CBS 119925]